MDVVLSQQSVDLAVIKLFMIVKYDRFRVELKNILTREGMEQFCLLQMIERRTTLRLLSVTCSR